MPNLNPRKTSDKEGTCRTCTDFQTWAKEQKENLEPEKKKECKCKDNKRDNCPLDKDELGRSTWGFLHTLAANFPEKPTRLQSSVTAQFFTLLPKVYPCEPCAEGLKEVLKLEPPETKSQESLSQWLCRTHNRINVNLGKPEFDCAKVNERWRDGWLDGSCD